MSKKVLPRDSQAESLVHTDLWLEERGEKEEFIDIEIEKPIKILRVKAAHLYVFLRVPNGHHRVNCIDRKSNA